jgi:hypothetical protein
MSYRVQFTQTLLVEEDSEDEAVSTAKNVLFDHLGRKVLKEEDFEVLGEE